MLMYRHNLTHAFLASTVNTNTFSLQDPMKKLTFQKSRKLPENLWVCMISETSVNMMNPTTKLSFSGGTSTAKNSKTRYKISRGEFINIGL